SVAPVGVPAPVPAHRAGRHPLPLRRRLPVVQRPDPAPLPARVLLLRCLYREDARALPAGDAELGLAAPGRPGLHRARRAVVVLVAVVLHHHRREVLGGNMRNDDTLADRGCGTGCTSRRAFLTGAAATAGAAAIAVLGGGETY